MARHVRTILHFLGKHICEHNFGILNQNHILPCKSDTFFRPVFLGGISTFVIQMDNSQHSAMSIGDDCHMEHARYLHSFGNLSKNWDEHEQKVQRVK